MTAQRAGRAGAFGAARDRDGWALLGGAILAPLLFEGSKPMSPYPPRSFFRLMMGAWGVWAVFLTIFTTPFFLIWHYAETPLDGQVPGVIAGVAGGVAVLFWLLSIRRARRLTRLRRIGMRTPARVIAHTKTGNRRGGGVIYRAEWRTETGLEGHTVPLRSERLPDVGEVIIVLLDPGGQLDGVWEAEV